MFLGVPLSDAAYSTAATDFYTRSRLAAGIELSSVPPPSGRSNDSSKSSDATSAETRPQQPQVRATPKAHAHATIDRVSISSAAKAAQPTFQLTVSASASATQYVHTPASDDVDSDRAREATEPATDTSAAEQAEAGSKASQGDHVQAEPSHQPPESPSAGSTNPGLAISSGRVDTYA